MATNYVNLDFKSIREDVKDFLRSQSEFTDFDFDGSAMTVLMDALAYATHLNALTANMVISEAYLDSSTIRRNTVSRSKELGYIPHSITSAIANIKLSITPSDSPASILVTRGTKFTTTIDNETFTFITMSDYSLTDIGGGVYETSFDIVQGVLREQSWIYDINSTDRFILDQGDVDSVWLSVISKPNIGSTDITTWTESNNIISLSPDSTAFFVQEAETGNVEIYFGDDHLSKALSDGEVITLEYIASRGTEANASDNFELIEDIGSYTQDQFTITTNTKALGGSDKETMDSMKLLAPKVYKTQNRMVIDDDYSSILLNKYGWIEAVNTWGGEENIPPQYGKVFISIKPNYGLTMSPATKTLIEKDILSKHNVIGITPQIVDPEYLYIRVTSEVVYDKTTTTLGAGSIKTLVEDTIVDYLSSAGHTFKNSVEYSKLVSVIDTADNSILNNDTDITVARKFTVTGGSTQSYEIAFTIPLLADGIISDTWIGSDTVTSYYIKDDPDDSKLYLYIDDIQQNAIGYMDYNIGTAYLNAFVPDVNINEEINLVASPVEQYVTVKGNNILLLDSSDITIIDYSTKIAE